MVLTLSCSLITAVDVQTVHSLIRAAKLIQTDGQEVRFFFFSANMAFVKNPHVFLNVISASYG